MKPVSKIAEAVRASTTLAVDSLAKQMKADGYDIISFATGEPDFDTPENIKQAGIEAIENGVSRVHILDGRIAHCLLLEIFTNKGVGTAFLGDKEQKFYNEDK